MISFGRLFMGKPNIIASDLFEKRMDVNVTESEFKKMMRYAQYATSQQTRNNVMQSENYIRIPYSKLMSILIRSECVDAEELIKSVPEVGYGELFEIRVVEG